MDKAVEQLIDKKTISGLNHCSIELPNCGHCPYRILGLRTCKAALAKDALELIQRQRSEIDRLKIDNKRMTTKIFEMAMNKAVADKVRVEAVKEFAEKLKDMSDVWEDDEFYFKYVTTEQIDTLVKEMAGENNGNV